MQTINPPDYYDKNISLSFEIKQKCDITMVKYLTKDLQYYFVKRLYFQKQELQ
jgi:hypothetical protein